MLPLKIQKDEPKDVLYARVKTSNKKFVEKQAKKEGVPVAAYIDYMVDCHRELVNASNKRKPRRRN